MQRSLSILKIYYICGNTPPTSYAIKWQPIAETQYYEPKFTACKACNGRYAFSKAIYWLCYDNYNIGSTNNVIQKIPKKNIF